MSSKPEISQADALTVRPGRAVEYSFRPLHDVPPEMESLAGIRFAERMQALVETPPVPMRARELTYPDEWLRGWEHALLRWPGAKGRVPLTIEPRSAEHDAEDEHVLQGAYDWRHPEIYLFPDDDRAEALCTLVHEYAHAWTPRTRGSHHPAAWRATYIALVYHLTNVVVREAQVYEDVHEVGRRYPDMKLKRRGDSWKATALDIYISSIFHNERLRIDRVDGSGGHCIRATCAGRVHLIDVLDNHASP